MLAMRGSCMLFRVINVFCVSMRKCCYTLKVEIMFVPTTLNLVIQH
jgi:hypothetical protein